MNILILYPEIASFTYQTIVASEQLLELAVSKTGGVLREYLEKHLEEERQHEKWLAEDLKELKIDVEELPYNVIAAWMAGSQYYILHHRNPVAFLGYMLALEGNPIPESVVKDIELIYGVKPVRTLRYHAKHDKEHGNDLRLFIATLNEKEKRLVYENFDNTMYCQKLAAEKIEQDHINLVKENSHG